MKYEKKKKLTGRAAVVLVVSFSLAPPAVRVLILPSSLSPIHLVVSRRAVSIVQRPRNLKDTPLR